GMFLSGALAAVGVGVEPAGVVQGGAPAGLPAPPLPPSGELSLTLMQKMRKATEEGIKAEGGGLPPPHGSAAVVDKMVDELNRPGRAGGAGFYEYQDGKRIGLWPGLREAFNSGTARPKIGRAHV